MRRSRRAGWIASGVGAGTLLACYPAGSIGGKPDANGRWIALSPVSREFVDAYEAQERRRHDERRSEVTRRA